MSFILDASVALLWLAPKTDPTGAPYAAAVLAKLKEGQALVPSLFALEISNVVVKLESKGWLSEADAQCFIAILGRLDMVTDQATEAHALGNTLNLARRYGLSAYDAAYLELALRSGLPMATLDADLAKAAMTAGVPIFGHTEAARR